MLDTDPLQRHNGHFTLDGASNGSLASHNGHRPVLVLNQNYEPLHVATVRRALVLWLAGKAEILETYDQDVASTHQRFPAPSVIRLFTLVKRPPVRVRLTRREVFARDNYTCQYCGIRTRPDDRSRDSPFAWWPAYVGERGQCLPGLQPPQRGKSLAEARMHLLRQPFEPRPGRYYLVERLLRTPVHESWLKFLPELDVTSRRSR